MGIHPIEYAAVLHPSGIFYAYRLIWNAICDELIRATRLSGKEQPFDSLEDPIDDILGDNTQNSWDSRYWEYTFVLRSNIVAVVIPEESLIYTKT